MPEATAMHPDKAELFAPSWTASALRHQLAFLKVAFLKDTADKTRDELVELKKNAGALRDDERATHVIEEVVSSDVSTDSSIENRMREEPHNFSDVTTDSSDSDDHIKER